jgi:hypothetical protein
MSFSRRKSARRAKLIDKRLKTPEEMMELDKLNKDMDLELMNRMHKLGKPKKAKKRKK